MVSRDTDRLQPGNGCRLPNDYTNVEEALHAGGEEIFLHGQNDAKGFRGD
jgi:hypothetical protein